MPEAVHLPEIRNGVVGKALGSETPSLVAQRDGMCAVLGGRRECEYCFSDRGPGMFPFGDELVFAVFDVVAEPEPGEAVDGKGGRK